MVIKSSKAASVPSDLRRIHRALVLERIFRSKESSRVQLAESTGLSAMAITRITRELIEAGLVEESQITALHNLPNPGRPRKELRIRPMGGHVFGVVISAFGHEIALFDAVGQICAQQSIPFRLMRSASSAIQATKKVIQKLIRTSNVNPSRVMGIGVAIAAFVEPSTGRLHSAPYLGWRRIEFGRLLAEATNLPVVVENIAHAMNVAEHAKGIAAGLNDVFLSHQSVTTGSSYLHEGRLVLGASYSAGQIGHLPLKKSSLFCSCGEQTCLNNYVSGWAVLAHLGLTTSKVFEVKDLQKYANSLKALISDNPSLGSKPGRVLFKAGYEWGVAMRNVALVVDPSAIILSGKLRESTAYVAGAKSAWLESMRRYGQRYSKLLLGERSSVDASGYLALRSFIYSNHLDVESLNPIGRETSALQGYAVA
jgi:predicted NBD/HSP70 family sugar kinase